MAHQTAYVIWPRAFLIRPLQILPTLGAFGSVVWIRKRHNLLKSLAETAPIENTGLAHCMSDPGQQEKRTRASIMGMINIHEFREFDFPAPLWRGLIRYRSRCVSMLRSAL